MKRYNNLYKNICKYNNILDAYNEVCRNTKNKRRVANYKSYKGIYIYRVYNILKEKNYKPGPVTIFTIYEPKERRIVSQNMQDKIINHLVARYILYPAILPCLLDVNVASRKELGTSAGLKLFKKYQKQCNIKYKNYYILKCDISKFFASIDHDILKQEKLTLNAKTRLYKNTNNFMFLGRNSKGQYSRYRNVKRKLKNKHYLYREDKVSLNSLCSSIICYNGLCERKIKVLKR